MNELALIHTSWLKPFADFFASRRISLQPYYDAANLEAKQVTSGEGWVTKHQLYGFLNTLSEGEKMPEVGFVVGETITPDGLGELGEAMAKAETLGGVVRTFCQLINRHVEGNRCWLEEADEGTVWLFNQKAKSAISDQSVADHAGLMSMVNLARLVGGSDWYPASMDLQTKATTAYRKVPGLKSTEVRFNQTAAGFPFPAHWLLRFIDPRAQADPGQNTMAGLLDHDECISEKMKRLLREIIGVGGICPTLKFMADLCGTSPRTLHRQLKNTGVYYQNLVDEVRREHAFSQLKSTDISIKELAYSLGYSGPNNFIRAFRRLSGVSPTQYRQSQAE